MRGARLSRENERVILALMGLQAVCTEGTRAIFSFANFLITEEKAPLHTLISVDESPAVYTTRSHPQKK